MSTPAELVQEVFRMAEMGQTPDIQPSILMHRNINPEQVVEMTSCFVNNCWAAKLKELLEQGFVLFRVQTEFGIIGHNTVAYFAKLRTS